MVDPLFSVVGGDRKYGVSPRTTQLTPIYFDCFIGGGGFVLSHSRYYPYISHSKN